MNIRSLVLTMLCCTRILPVHSFKHIQTRGFVRTTVLMRSKKKLRLQCLRTPMMYPLDNAIKK